MEFLHCIGAIDGNYVNIQARNGSIYFIYKKTFSKALHAICNTKYEFSLVDIGSAGSDGGIFHNSVLGIGIENKLLNFPQPKPISGFNENQKFPYTFIAYEAVPSRPHVMRAYLRKGELNLWETILNYHLLRKRRVIENTFGILVNRFRIFLRPTTAHVDNAKFITKAITALHNFLMKTQSKSSGFDYRALDFVDQVNGSVEISRPWHREVADVQGMVQLNNQGSNDFERIVKEVRGNFKKYFNLIQGSVPWQDRW